MIWIRKWYVQMYRGHRTYDEGILQPIRAHSLRHPLQEMQKTRFGDQIHKLWTVLRCVKMWNNVKHVWSKGYSRASRSPRSSGPFTQRHSRATSVALASVRSPLAWRCRRCHMDFHESKLDVARVLPHLLDLERCAKIAILCQRLEARENESKLESITQAQMFFAGPWGPILPEGFKSFFVQSMRAPKGLETESEKANSKKISTETVKWTSRLPRRKFFILLSIYLSMLGSAEW